ncbi:MAG: hypothetical protein HY901_21695 [Deltaproteobacteria bacterium]|nr:hypothetical protein [Deltaproteobacteria bacterium]
MSPRIPIELVGSPSHLPKPNKGRVAVLDVAFASGDKYDLVTEPFIQLAGDGLALWCDHHEHPLGWSKYRHDPRFVLVPNREAHACPELVTPEVAARAGEVGMLVVHGDFDGMLTGVKLLRHGEPPYPEADEDARAVDSPGRGHALSARGRRIAYAVDEAVASFTAGPRRDFMTEIMWALVEGHEPAQLGAQIDRAAEAALAAQEQTIRLAQEHGKQDVPGLFVIRLQGRRQGRQRKGMLRFAEEHATVGVVVESDGRNTWVTAATFDERIDLGTIELLDGGRSDYRYAEPKTGGVEPILRALARAVADR